MEKGVSELRAGHRHQFPPPKKKKSSFWVRAVGATTGTSTELNAGPQHRDLFWAPAHHQPPPRPRSLSHLRPSLIHGGRGGVVLRGPFCCSPLLPGCGSSPVAPAQPR